MMRFISILLVIAGLLAAGVGAAALLDTHMPRGEVPATASAPTPDMPDATTPPEVSSTQAPDTDDFPPAPHPPAPVVDPSEPMDAAPEVRAESDPMSEEELSFQPMREDATAPDAETPAAEAEGPAMRSMRSAPDATEAAAADTAPEAVDIDDPNVTTAVSESFIDKLKTVPVAHETPPSAEYKRAFDVTFAIDATGDDTAVDALPGRGVIQEGEARVSDRVEVRVSGAAFAIVPTSPPVQSLSPLTENTWRWSVTALSAGDHDLTFEIFAIDADEVVPLRTYRDTVTVKVSGLNRAIAFADQANPLFVLLGGLGSILAGVLGVARFVLKK